MANLGLLKKMTMQYNSVDEHPSVVLLVGAEATVLLNIVVTLGIVLAFRAKHVPIALIDGKLIDSSVCRYVQLFGVLMRYRERDTTRTDEWRSAFVPERARDFGRC